VASLFPVVSAVKELKTTEFLHLTQSVLSTGFAFCVMWNVLENGYLEPHANTRIDFTRERGKVRNRLI